MKRPETAILLCIVLSLVLFISGCRGRYFSKEELIERVVEANLRMQTFRFEGETFLTIRGEEEDEEFEREIPIRLSAVLDLVNRRMQMETRMGGIIEALSGPTTIYAIDDTMYANIVVPGILDYWVKSDMPPELWDSQNRLNLQIRMLETSEFISAGSDWVNGTRCYFVEYIPNMEAALRVMLEQLGIEELTGDVLPSTSFRDVNMKLWIARDTFFPMRSSSEMTLDLSGEEEVQTSVLMRQHFRFYDYNEPVSIVLPEKAKKAIYVPEPPLPGCWSEKWAAGWAWLGK